MAFTSTGLSLMVPGMLNNGSGAVWRYYSSDSSTQILATGYFANCGYGSRGSSAFQMQIGDVVMNVESSGGATPGKTNFCGAYAATANVASTVASSGYSAGYNVTVRTAT